MQKFTTFLMFSGQAEEAMRFYTSLFENSGILAIERYGNNEAGAKDTVKHAIFTLDGQEFMAIDSNVEHGFGFTPAISIFVQCKTEAEINGAYRALLDGGQALMTLGNHGFSQKFAWVADQYGVSWQLNLP